MRDTGLGIGIYDSGDRVYGLGEVWDEGCMVQERFWMKPPLVHGRFGIGFMVQGRFGMKGSTALVDDLMFFV
jgi:hypothetical protein